jgi:thiamine-phosphate pyrophosphorylase
MQNNPFFYLFVDNYHLDELFSLKKNINLIYRNYDNKIDTNSIKKLHAFCQKTNRKLFIANDYKLAFNLNLDGVYLPSFNQKLNIIGKSRRKNFKIIGSAHNIKEIKIKITQGCELIFLSPLFKTKKNNSFLGVIKFNLLKLNQRSSFVALGGINDFNYKKIYLTKSRGIAGIKWLKKNGPRNILRPFL